MRDLVTSLFPLQPIRILGWSRSRKCVQSDMRPLETLLFRLQQSRIFGWCRGKNDFPVFGDHLKHRFLDLTKVEFWACQEAEHDFFYAIRSLE